MALSLGLVAMLAGTSLLTGPYPDLPELLASSGRAPEPDCRRHLSLFARDLRQRRLWAVQMLDASARLPGGVVAGNVFQPGQFDECLEVSVDDLRGRHCMLELSYWLPVEEEEGGNTSAAAGAVDDDIYDLRLDPRAHVWEKLKDRDDQTRVRRSVLHLGLCVPASCGAAGLQETLDQELRELGERSGLLVRARVSEPLCTTRTPGPPLSAAEIAYSSVAGLMAFLVASSSLHVYLRGRKFGMSAFDKLLASFAVQHNWKRFLKLSKGTPALNAISGARVVFLIGSIAGHRAAICYATFLQDASAYENLFRGLFKSSLIGGILAVDFFFVISGTVLSYFFLLNLRKYEGQVILRTIFLRLTRLLPAYMMVVLFLATWFPRLGSGPLWETTVALERTRCQHSWWTNLLFINNYVNVQEMCMFQSWFISCDTQLYFLCLPVVYCIRRKERCGCALLVVLLVVASLLPLVNTWRRGAGALFVPIAENVNDPPSSQFFREVYVKTEDRAISFLVGILVGVILEKTRSSKFRLGKWPSVACFVVMSGTIVGSALAAYPFYRPGTTHTALQAGVYAALSRLLFSVSCGGFSLLITFGSVGPLMQLLSWKPLRVVSKLSYGAFLVHTLSLLYNKGSLRAPFPPGAYTLVWLLVGDVVFSFSLSLLLLLVVEYPVRGLESLLSSGDRATMERLCTSLRQSSARMYRSSVPPA